MADDEPVDHLVCHFNDGAELLLTLPMPKGRGSVKPIHRTNSAVKNGFTITTEYTDYDVYKKFEKPLVEHGWDVIVFVPSEEEDSDRITCGNALIAEEE